MQVIILPISRFEIRDQGPIHYAKCDNVPRILIVAGPNGVGKSTLLECLKRRQGTVEGIKSQPLYIPPHRAPAPFPLYKSLPVIGPRRRFREVLRFDSFSLNAPGVSLPIYITSGTSRSRLTPDFAPYVEVKYKLAQFEQEFKDSLADVYKSRGEVPKGFMPDIWQPFRKLVSALLPGLHFEEVKIEGEICKVLFKNRLGKPIEFDDLSSGEKDIIAILFPFVEKQVENELANVKGIKPPHEELVVLIDTPEAYLHPTLQRSFLNYIRELVKEAKEEIQFIIATHSTTIVSMANSEELYALVFPDQSYDGNQLIKVASDEEKLYLIRDILGDVTFILAGKPLLLLEGPHDVELLSLLLPKLKEKFILKDLGGKAKVKGSLRALQNVISELEKKGFRMFAILDKDVGESIFESNECFTWPVYCIENFLLDSECIYEALKVIVGDAKLQLKGIRAREDIDKMIDSIIKNPETIESEIKERIRDYLKFYYGIDWKNLEELRQKVFEITKVKLENIETTYNKIKIELLQIVGERERALKELNGKILLKKIAENFNVNPEILAREIAEKLRLCRKLPPQLLEILSKIGFTPN
jgi:DNA polymerase III delta prime subunit